MVAVTGSTLAHLLRFVNSGVVRRLATVSSTYGYNDIARRLGQVLGENVAVATLRAAAATTRRTRATSSQPRLTAAMPSPLPSSSPTAPARFDADEVEAWLADHPRLVWARAVEKLDQVLTDPDICDEDAVTLALAAGLSWRQITDAWNRRRPARTVAGLHKKFRHLDQRQRDEGADHDRRTERDVTPARSPAEQSEQRHHRADCERQQQTGTQH